MKKYIFLPVILLNFVGIGFAQQFCLPVIGGVLGSDEPPGCLLCSNEYHGSTKGFTPDTLVENFRCGDIDNNQWFSVRADLFGEINLKFQTNNCEKLQGIEVAIFNRNLQLIRCDSFQNLLDWKVTQLDQSEIYRLMIDGRNGDICDFSIERIVPKQFITWKTNNAGRRQVCPGAEVCFEASLGFPVSQYEWKIDTSVLTVLAGGGLRDSFLCVRFDSIGSSNISVNPITFCNADYFSSREISVTDDPVFIRKRTRALCLPDMPYSEFGQQIDSFGFSRIIYKTAEGCDSIYEFTINRFFVEENDSGIFCEGDTVFIDNQPIHENGIHRFLYEFENQNQCDSIFNFNFIQVDTAAPEITCFIDTFVRAVGIKWEPNPFIDQYALQINDSLIVLGNQSGYLYSPNVRNEQLNISLKPFSNRCFHHISYAQCIGPEKISGVKERKEESLIIYPNPGVDIFELRTENKILETEIFNFSGAKILRTNSTKIDLSAHPRGVYFFKIKAAKSFFIKKVVKT